MRFRSGIILALLCALIVIRLGAVQGIVVINDDDKDVDISGWSITNSEGRSMIIPQGAVIKGLDYYVLDVRSRWLAQTGEVLVLTDAGGAEVDRTATLRDKEDNEIAWTRDPDGRDTNSTDDWKFLAGSRGF